MQAIIIGAGRGQRLMPTTADTPKCFAEVGGRRVLDWALAALRANGVEILEEPRDARTFWGKQGAIKDPSGYIITLREYDEPDNPRYPDWQPRHEDVKRLG